MVSNFPSNWRLFPLEDCMDAIIDYRGKTPQKTTSGIPLITAKIVKGGRIQSVEEFISPDHYDDWMRRGLPKPGDILMTTEAPLGEIAQLDNRKVALAQRLITLRGKKGFLDNNYLKFLLQSDFVQNQLAARATGTTVLGIKQSELRKVSLVVPPLDEQKAIAHILGTLDDKIELNQQMNRTLEGIARALFKSWFIDFDPVRAKLDGRQPAGMDAETAALFPAEFEDGGAIGQIPKGWKNVTIKDVAEVTDYVANGSFSSLKDNVQYLDQPDFAILVRLADHNRGWTGDYVYVSEAAYNFLNKSFLEPEDIVIANVGANAGTVFKVPDLGQPMTLGPNAVVVRPRKDNKGISKQFLYYLLSGTEGQNQLQSILSGSAQPKFNKTDFRSLPVMCPSSDTLKAFQKITDPIWRQEACINSQTRSLINIRDVLLPKLLSSEIRVKEAEKIVAEVA